MLRMHDPSEIFSAFVAEAATSAKEAMKEGHRDCFEILRRIPIEQRSTIKADPP